MGLVFLFCASLILFVEFAPNPDPIVRNIAGLVLAVFAGVLFRITTEED
jgi:hypothetical protein